MALQAHARRRGDPCQLALATRRASTQRALRSSAGCDVERQTEMMCQAAQRGRRGKQRMACQWAGESATCEQLVNGSSSSSSGARLLAGTSTSTSTSTGTVSYRTVPIVAAAGRQTDGCKAARSTQHAARSVNPRSVIASLSRWAAAAPIAHVDPTRTLAGKRGSLPVPLPLQMQAGASIGEVGSWSCVQVVCAAPSAHGPSPKPQMLACMVAGAGRPPG